MVLISIEHRDPGFLSIVDLECKQSPKYSQAKIISHFLIRFAEYRANEFSRYNIPGEME
jgi:hypothetical protein